MEATNEQLIKKIDELQSKRLAHRLSDKIKEALSFVGFILSTLGAVGLSCYDIYHCYGCWWSYV